MARITVEDCLKYVGNRFNLVIIASKRARQLAKGGMSYVEGEQDKPTVLALREIATGRVNFPDPKAMEQAEDDDVEITVSGSIPENDQD